MLNISRMSAMQPTGQFIEVKSEKWKRKQFFKSAQLNHRWRRHFAEIESNRIYYQSPHHLEARSRRVWPRWTEMFGVPFLWVSLWFTQSILTGLGYTRFHNLVNTPLKRMLLGMQIIPSQCRYNFAIVVFMCASVFLLGFTFEAFCPLGRFNCLAIFVCNRRGVIKPKHLKLKVADFDKFSKFRNYVERLYYLAIVLSTVALSSAWAILSIAFGTFTISRILSILNVISAYFWAISVSQGMCVLEAKFL